jgi:hypothetical protein
MGQFIGGHQYELTVFVTTRIGILMLGAGIGQAIANL